MGRPSRDGLVTSLASLVPLVAPHFRKGDVDLALLKHQGLAVAAGLAVSLLQLIIPLSNSNLCSRTKTKQRKYVLLLSACGGQEEMELE